VATGALAQQPGEKHLNAVDGTPQIDVDQPAPVLMGHLCDRSYEGHTGVVKDDVNRAEKPMCFIGQPINLVEVPDVAHNGVGVEPVGPQSCDRFVECGLIDVAQYDARPALGEFPRGGKSYATGPAGDHRCPTRESLHRPNIAQRQMKRVVPALRTDTPDGGRRAHSASDLDHPLGLGVHPFNVEHQTTPNCCGTPLIWARRCRPTPEAPRARYQSPDLPQIRHWYAGDTDPDTAPPALAPGRNPDLSGLPRPSSTWPGTTLRHAPLGIFCL
jgi:hypothetical protein